MDKNKHNHAITVVLLVPAGAAVPTGAISLDRDNPHICIHPGSEHMRCPACEIKKQYEPDEIPWPLTGQYPNDCNEC